MPAIISFSHPGDKDAARMGQKGRDVALLPLTPPALHLHILLAEITPGFLPWPQGKQN